MADSGHTATEMPLPFAEILAVALGAALAWVAAPALTRSDAPLVVSRPFLAVLAFTGLIWVPVVGYFMAFHGDWSLLYLAERHTVPSALQLALVLSAGVFVMAGFCVSVGPVRRRRFVPVLALVAIPSVALLAALPLASRRLALSGSYAQFHGDFGTEPIGASLLGKSVLLMGVVLVLGLSWTVHSLVRFGADARA